MGDSYTYMYMQMVRGVQLLQCSTSIWQISFKLFFQLNLSMLGLLSSKAQELKKSSFIQHLIHTKNSMKFQGA